MTYYNQNVSNGFIPAQQQNPLMGMYAPRSDKPKLYVFLPPVDSVISLAQQEGSTRTVSRPININASDTAIGNCVGIAHELSKNVAVSSMAPALANVATMTGVGAINGLFSINGEAAASLPQFDTAKYWSQPSFVLVIPPKSDNIGSSLITPPTYAIVSGICSDWPCDVNTGTLNHNCRLIVGAGNYVTQSALSHAPVVTGFVRARNDIINSAMVNPSVQLFDATPNTHCNGLSFEPMPVLGGDYSPGSINAVAYLDNTKVLNNTGAETIDLNAGVADPVNNAVCTMSTLLHGVERAISPSLGMAGVWEDSVPLSDQITTTMVSHVNNHTKATNHGMGMLDNVSLVQGSTLTVGALIGKFGDIDVYPIDRGVNNIGGNNMYDNLSTLMGQCTNPIVSRILLEQQIVSCTFVYQSMTNALELSNVAGFHGELSVDQIRLAAGQIANKLSQYLTPLAVGMGHPNYILSASYSASFGTTSQFKSLDSNDIADPRGIHSPLFMGVIGAGTLLADRAHSNANVSSTATIFQALATGMMQDSSPVLSHPQQYNTPATPALPTNLFGGGYEAPYNPGAPITF